MLVLINRRGSFAIFTAIHALNAVERALRVTMHILRASTYTLHVAMHTLRAVKCTFRTATWTLSALIHFVNKDGMKKDHCVL